MTITNLLQSDGEESGYSSFILEEPLYLASLEEVKPQGKCVCRRSACYRRRAVAVVEIEDCFVWFERLELPIRLPLPGAVQYRSNGSPSLL